MPNLYEVLGLTVGAEAEHVKAAFRKHAKTSHPDVNTTDATAETRFKEVNQAYEILSDPARRAAYDLGLKHRLGAAQRRLRNAMAATNALIATLGFGFYVSLYYSRHPVAGHRVGS